MEPCTQIDRLSRMETKIDTLLEFKWRMSGGWIWLSIAACVVLSIATTALAVAQYLK